MLASISLLFSFSAFTLTFRLVDPRNPFLQFTGPSTQRTTSKIVNTFCVCLTIAQEASEASLQATSIYLKVVHGTKTT